MRKTPFALAGLILLLALLVPVLPLPPPLVTDVAHRLAPPSANHWLGQDEFGRDVLARLLWGARVSLSVAVSAAGIACLAGVTLGLIGGTLGPLAALLAVRGMDIVLCFPPLLLALLVVTLFGPGAATLIPVLALVTLPGFTRAAYSGTLQVRAHDYVDAMRLLGAGWPRIMLRTILPNIAGPVLVQLSLSVAACLVLESGLSFLGLGVVPPAPSWGLTIAAARTTMAQAPLLLLWPCLALSLTILAMNAVCDALRDAVDPQRHPGRKPRARPSGASARPSDALLAIDNLTIEIQTPAGPVWPVRDVSLRVAAGEMLALVGESGSGKSLTGLAVMGLLPAPARAVHGSAWLDGNDLLRLADPDMRRLRGGRMAMVFQDPLSSLNPVHRIGAQIVEAIAAHRPMPRAAATRLAVEALRQCGIPAPESRSRAYAHELSGGMRQRAMLAMAIANSPKLLIADEPTTALDVTIQAQVLRLVATLRQSQGMGVLFITHSLAVVAEIADRVAVMYAGEIVEEGKTADLFADPRHPYTRALLNSAPREDGVLPVGIQGGLPSLYEPPPGCAFAPRCTMRRPACELAPPRLQTVAPGRTTRCIDWRRMPEATP